MGDALSETGAKSLKRLAAVHGAQNVRRVPGRAGLVFLVDMDKGRNLFDLVALTDELREALGTEVNVLTEGSLSPYLRDADLAEAVAL
jgi:hypothetical protein